MGGSFHPSVFLTKEIIMARKKGTIDVTGLSIGDIMNIDIDTFNKLGAQDLRRITSRLVSAGNKRIRALEKKGITSPAYRSIGESGKFSVKMPKGLNKQQIANKLRQEYSRVRSFLSKKTSTIRGYNEYVKDVKEEISKSIEKPVKDVNVSRAFEVLHKMQESGKIPVNTTGSKGGSRGSIHARDFIIEKLIENPEISEDALINSTQEDYENYYEEETEESEI